MHRNPTISPLPYSGSYSGGGYEVYRKYISNSLDKERETVHIMDDRDCFAIIDTLTVENGTTLTTPVETVRYQYSNHLGSACLELDASAAIISYEEYHPFGTTSYRSGRNEVDVSLKRYKYVGKERDEETGLYYYGARYYAAWIARFISVDPLNEKYPELSAYQYASNRPIIAIDLDGLEAKLLITDNIIGYTSQHIYGDQLGVTEITVPVYDVILIDAQNPSKEIAHFGVTRDAWYSRGTNSEGTHLVNRAFEPKDGNKNLYGTVPLNYPSGFSAYALRRQGNANLEAEPFTKDMNTYLNGEPIDDARENLGIANGVMFHIGGYYNNGTKNKLAGSYGCFGFIPKNQIYKTKSFAEMVTRAKMYQSNKTSNESYNDAINQIIEVKNNTNGIKTVQIQVEKRNNVEKARVVQ